MDEAHPLKHTAHMHMCTHMRVHTYTCMNIHTCMHTRAHRHTQKGSEPHPISFAGLFHADELGVTHGNKFLRGHTWLKLLSQ